jgi:MazG family protein
LEEAWEVIDEIEQGRVTGSLKEELGDLLLQIVLHAEIASEEKRFSFQDVVAAISEKMVHRHPHVFEAGGNKLTDEELHQQWQSLKAGEKSSTTIWDSYLPSAPSLLNAFSISKKAAGMGFDWETAWDVLSKVEEELEEIRQEMKAGDVERIEEEIGDLLFTVTNLARFYKINPEIALKKGNDKFMKRFEAVEKEIKEAKEKGKSLSLNEMEYHWQQAKTEQKIS